MLNLKHVILPCIKSSTFIPERYKIKIINKNKI